MKEHPDQPAGAEKDRKFVTALARGLDVLRAFEPRDNLLGNQEIARRTGLPKPTVTRLTYTLTKLGYLSYNKELERYQLGMGVLALGYATLANFGIRQIARPYMQDLAEEVNASVALGARERLSMMYLDHRRASGEVTLRLDIGSRIPLATTAMGRAFLAALPEVERGYLMTHLEKRTGPEKWPAVRRGIETACEQYATHGFVTTVGDWEKEVNAVGVPLIETTNGDVFAFNCGAPSFLLAPDRLESEVGPRLKYLVQNVQAAISRI
ncbi:IclR family transcriptional regulator [Salinisphaera orenii MK-B5]|uniref:IclR family transcriptional regulator n=2 Tax=Salinisphaera orenii TaxID=856731 RepID=A0A423PG39_9GAMM|nr:MULTISPECIES: IclR family transcriptional regulator [Salinisphaera]ROO24493.1 IclR family transcriptional regulator [Salinisphaera orenii MK-B5]ROO27897.1 IclR family transcriptional regulator [Salinisphaera halophila YIM 95161]